jgi:hypothetical protein
MIEVIPIVIKNAATRNTRICGRNKIEKPKISDKIPVIKVPFHSDAN